MSDDARHPGFVLGGYFVTQRVVRPAAMGAGLLPQRLLTASPCLTHFVPDAWLIAWTSMSDEERQKIAEALCVDDATRHSLTQHVTAELDAGAIGWPNVVSSFEALARLWALLPPGWEWTAFALGLHERHVPAFLAQNAPREGIAPGGVYECVLKGLALPSMGVALGFEPLGFEGGCSPHSWLCNGLEQECDRALGIRPNSFGFLATEDEAERAVAHIASPDVGAEPVQWLPWMIVDCSADLATR